jgi:hypothetical protein
VCERINSNAESSLFTCDFMLYSFDSMPNTLKTTDMSDFLITNVRIFDGQIAIDRGSVLISGGKIAKVSPAPKEFDGPVISKPGHTLLPGFIDAHVHVDFGNESGLAQGLRFGVATQCDLGNAPFQIEKLRDLVKDRDCSDLNAAMQSATAEGGWPAPLLKVVMRQVSIILHSMLTVLDDTETRYRASTRWESSQDAGARLQVCT